MTDPTQPTCEIIFSGIGGPWFAEPERAFGYLAEILDARPETAAWPRAVSEFADQGIVRVNGWTRADMSAGSVVTACACPHGCAWSGPLADAWMWHGRLVCAVCAQGCP
jgi:hypothetical protein